MSSISNVSSSAQYSVLRQLQARSTAGSVGGTKRSGGDGDGDADDGGSAPSVGESTESGQSGALSSQAASLLNALVSGRTQQSQVANLPTGSLLDVAA